MTAVYMLFVLFLILGVHSVLSLTHEDCGHALSCQRINTGYCYLVALRSCHTKRWVRTRMPWLSTTTVCSLSAAHFFLFSSVVKKNRHCGLCATTVQPYAKWLQQMHGGGNLSRPRTPLTRFGVKRN